MLVPLVDAASVSPVSKPLVIDTVPETRLALSGSLTVVPEDNVVALAPAVYESDAATLPSTGACDAVILTVVVCVALLRVPSLTTQEIARLGSAPELVGFWLLDE